MSMIETQTSDELTLSRATVGYPHVPPSTLLTRLNYFDGKFLRAEDLRTEQEYHRRHVELSNRGGGAGVVEGFDVARAGGDNLTVGGGLAVDTAGRLLYLPDAFTVSLQKVIDASTRAAELAQAEKSGNGKFAPCTPGDGAEGNGGVPGASQFYKLSIAHAEDACGNEDVYGKLCEDACATDEQRRYLVEGVVLRATPFTPRTPFPNPKAVALTSRHVRSLLASAWFADEAEDFGTPMSAAWLASSVWCRGAQRDHSVGVPIAVVGRVDGGLVVDEWIVRRERIETPPRTYWAWNMAMRPWNVFLAQILQFQCQLGPASKAGGGAPGYEDPCKPHVDALAEAERYIEQVDVIRQKWVKEYVGEMRDKPVLLEGGFEEIKGRIHKLRTSVPTTSTQILIDGGIVELPSAGYLPVVPGTSPSVEQQVRRWMGPGVDLRFCAVRTDYVPHALETAQHMERISLLTGLDDPAKKPEVDILVPDGRRGTPKTVDRLYFDTTIDLADPSPAGGGETFLLTVARGLQIRGAGRAESTAGGGATFYISAATELDPDDKPSFNQPAADVQNVPGAGTPLRGELGATTTQPQLAEVQIVAGFGRVDAALWGEVTLEQNPFSLAAGESTSFTAAGSAVLETTFRELTTTVLEGTAHGTLTTKDGPQDVNGDRVVECTIDVHGEGTSKAKHSESAKGDLTVEIELRQRAADAGSPRVLATLLRDGKPAAEVGADWNEGRPAKIDLALWLEPAVPETMMAKLDRAAPLRDQTLPIATAVLQEDADVAKPTNHVHAIAIESIEAIAKGRGAAVFGDTERKHLFPDPQTVETPGLVATRDWVLFHRRRTADCGDEPKPPAPVTTDRYRIFTLDQEAAGRTAFTNKSVGPLPSFGLEKLLTEVGEVEFAAGSSVLVTGKPAVVADWKQANPGPAIAAAAVAAIDPAQAPSLLLKRVAAYEAAISTVSKPGPNAPSKVTPALVQLAKGDAGVILIATQETGISHCVYVIASGNSTAETAFKKLLTSGDVAAFEKTKGVVNLGTVTFAPGTADPIGQVDLLDLESAGGPQYVQSATCLQDNDKAVPESDFDAQVKKICTLVKSRLGELKDDRIHGASVDATLPCSVVTILRANEG